MKRIVNTNSTELNLKREYILSDITWEGIKPTGLWYSLGNEWIDWCEGNMCGWVKPKIIEIEIDLSKMLIIETIDDVENCIKKYSKELYSGSHLFNIDWEEMSCHYTGIEIRNYHSLKWGRMNFFSRKKFTHKIDFKIDDLWLSAWDVSSGCIWDLSIIKSHKLYSLKQFKKENAEISE